MASPSLTMGLSTVASTRTMPPAEIGKLLKNHLAGLLERYPLTVHQFLIGDQAYLNRAITYGAVVVFHPDLCTQADCTAANSNSAWMGYKKALLDHIKKVLNEEATKLGGHVLGLELDEVASAIWSDMINQHAALYPSHPPVGYFTANEVTGRVTVSGIAKIEREAGKQKDTYLFRWGGTVNIYEVGNSMLSMFSGTLPRYKSTGTVTLQLVVIDGNKMAKLEEKTAYYKQHEPELLEMDPLEDLMAQRRLSKSVGS